MNIAQQIDKFHLEDLNNILHTSTFDKSDSYDMLILRFPVIKEELDSISLGFIFTEKNTYQYSSIDKRFDTLGNRFEGTHTKIDILLDKLLKSFNSYQEQISDMEESLYEDTVKTNFMTQWIGLKRDILRIERILFRTSNVMQEMISHYQKLEEFPINHYEDVHEHCERIVRASTLQLSKLDYLYSFYNTRTNEKMNRLIFFLTIVSAIFLPLNLIVGFFGMNTSGLPFTGGSGGTLNVIGGLLTLIVITIFSVILWQRRSEHFK